MKIQYSDLIKIFEMLINALAKGNYYQADEDVNKEFDFLYDFYWLFLNDEERYDLSNEPKELGVGSIEHDLERILQCIQDNDPMFEHFRYLGNVFIAMADTIKYRFYQGEGIGL